MIACCYFFFLYFLQTDVSKITVCFFGKYFSVSNYLFNIRFFSHIKATNMLSLYRKKAYFAHFNCTMCLNRDCQSTRSTIESDYRQMVIYVEVTLSTMFEICAMRLQWKMCSRHTHALWTMVNTHRISLVSITDPIITHFLLSYWCRILLICFVLNPTDSSKSTRSIDFFFVTWTKKQKIFGVCDRKTQATMSFTDKCRQQWESIWLTRFAWRYFYVLLTNVVHACVCVYRYLTEWKDKFTCLLL